MKYIKAQLICDLYRFIKKVIGKSVDHSITSFSIRPVDSNILFHSTGDVSVNGESHKNKDIITSSSLFPVENIISHKDYLKSSAYAFSDSFLPHKDKIRFGVKKEEATNTWMKFIKNSEIPVYFKNGGLHFAGYIASNINEWCLPSWIWTNAALVRMYCNLDNLTEASALANKLMKLQQECGGWVVRNEYNDSMAIPFMAPNDSAYVANNAMLTMYDKTSESKYLESAKKCADWIISTAREDGFIYNGFDIIHNKWHKESNIVDTGFTAALFANLFRITKSEKYKLFLLKFAQKYIELFYDGNKHSFFTCIDKNDQTRGGYFARGQAWALEGLIPTYLLTKDKSLYDIINATTKQIVANQYKDGSWPHNFARKLYGIDCKGIPVIAKNLIDWYNINHDKALMVSAQKAFQWCMKNTAINTMAEGGIFAFSLEGAVVHHLFTNTAFVYASAYAIELDKILRNE